MKELELVNAYGDDWEGLYVNGVLFCQGHSLRDYDWVDLLKQHPEGVRLVSFASGEVDLDWLHNRGDLPAKLEDVDFTEEPRPW